jgi:hypothetical protein
LRRAHRWQRMLDEARFASVRELAEAEQVGPTSAGSAQSADVLAMALKQDFAKQIDLQIAVWQAQISNGPRLPLDEPSRGAPTTGKVA